MAANIDLFPNFFFFHFFSKKKNIFLSFSISPNLCSNLKTWWSLTHSVPTLICEGKHNICVGNREIILIGNREIKRPRICHDFKTTNLNSREFKWGYSMSWWTGTRSLYMHELDETMSCERHTFPCEHQTAFAFNRRKNHFFLKQLVKDSSECIHFACSNHNHSVADPGFEVRGAHFFRISNCTPPPLRGFPEATTKLSLYLDFFFRISNCTPPPPLEHFSWGHYKSLYLDFFLRISICIPLDHFAWSHYNSLLYTWIF